MKTNYTIGKLIKFKTQYDSELIGSISKIFIDSEGYKYLVNGIEINEADIIASYSEDKKAKVKTPIKRGPRKAKIEITKAEEAVSNPMLAKENNNDPLPY
jgi:hypothetical protein